MPLEDRVENLQFIRYSLLREQNTDTFARDFMIKMNNDSRFKNKFSKSSIKYNSPHFQEKINLINEELGKSLQQVRAEHKTKLSLK